MNIPNGWGNYTLLIIYSAIIMLFIISAGQTYKYLKERRQAGGVSLVYVSDVILKTAIVFVFSVSVWVRYTATTQTMEPWKSDLQFYLWLSACLLLLLSIVIKVWVRWGGEWDLYAFFSFEKGNKYFYVKRINSKGGK